MEDVYNAHDQFWTWTLEPALEKVPCLALIYLEICMYLSSYNNYSGYTVDSLVNLHFWDSAVWPE